MELVTNAAQLAPGSLIAILGDTSFINRWDLFGTVDRVEDGAIYFVNDEQPRTFLADAGVTTYDNGGLHPNYKTYLVDSKEMEFLKIAYEQHVHVRAESRERAARANAGAFARGVRNKKHRNALIKR